jgi:hypothetical protein
LTKWLISVQWPFSEIIISIWEFVRELATAYYQLLSESMGIPAETFGRVARIKCKKGNLFALVY